MAVTTSERRALNTHRPFSRAHALAAGISLRELLSPRFHKIFHGYYISADVPITARLRADTALALSPTGSWVSHCTAARLWGAVVPDCADVHVTTPTDEGRSVRRGIKSHAAGVAMDTTSMRGLPITTAVQTFLDLAAHGLDLIDMVILGDSMVKAQKGLTADGLRAAAAASTARGARRARHAARFVRDGVDSAMETRVRMIIVLAGLPEPDVNLIFLNPDGSWRWRLDLYYRELKLVIEYDGRGHLRGSRKWQQDLKRREDLEALGWRFVVITASDFYDSPETILVRVRDALLERGATGIRRHFRTEWQRFFAND